MVENYPVEIQKEGSYVTGLIGALLGAAVGAVAWCLVMQLGIIAALVGFAIGWLAEKGYTLLKGKAGKGKLVILIIAVIFGVLLGTFAAHAVDWYKAIAEYYPDAVATINGREVLVGYGDIPKLIVYTLSTDSEYLGATVTDVLLGLLFAFMGVIGILKSAAGKKPAPQNEPPVNQE
jgi:hypothetical protein